jgi:hypothetical protein
MSAMKLQDLIAVSGDARLLDYLFSNGELRATLDLDQIEKIAEICVRTDAAVGAKGFAQNIAIQTCRLELLSLGSLETQHGHFIPSPDFGTMMKEIKCGLFLAYGKKSSGSDYVLSFNGVERLLSCYIGDIEDVVIQTR